MGNDMEKSDALQAITDIDEQDRSGRTERLQELIDLLPDNGLVGFNGTAPQLMFEDVKATWIYGCFVSTVITSYTFCLQQLAGNLRLSTSLASDAVASDVTLEGLGALASSYSLVTPEQHASIVGLHDRAQMYLNVSVDEYKPGLERHLIEVDVHTDDDALFTDARLALTTAVSLLLVRNE